METLPRPSLTAALGSDTDLPSSPTRLQHPTSLNPVATHQPSSEQHDRSSVDSQSATGSLRLGGISRTFARLNPIKKGKSKMSSFVPNVLYSRDDADSLTGSREVLGKAKISNFEQEKKYASSHQSSNNSSIPEFMAEESPVSPVYTMGKKGLRDHDFHVDCCGVVMAKPHQNIQHHFMQLYPRGSVEMTGGNLSPTGTHVAWRTKRYFSIQESHSQSAKAAEFFIGQEKSIEEKEDIPSDLENESHDKSDEVPTGNLIDFSDASERPAESMSHSSVTPGVHQGQDSAKTVLDSDWVNLDITEAPSQPVNEDICDKNKKSNMTTNSTLLQPIQSLKVSLSDSALSSFIFASDRTDGNGPTGDDRQNPLQAIASFSRLRNRMTSLAMPSKQSPQTRRKLLMEHAQNNMQRSSEMFSQCKSKIILL